MKVICAFNLVSKSLPNRGIGHSGIIRSELLGFALCLLLGMWSMDTIFVPWPRSPRFFHFSLLFLEVF